MNSEKQRIEDIFDKAVNYSLLGASGFFKSDATEEEGSEVCLLLLNYACEYDYSKNKIYYGSIIDRFLTCARALASRKFLKTLEYKKASESMFFKWAELDVLQLMSNYQTMGYVLLISKIYEIAHHLAYAGYSNILDDGKIDISDCYTHQGFIDAGLPKSILKPIILDKLAIELEKSGVGQDIINAMKEEA